MAKSLAAQSGALTTELNLPSVFSAPQEPMKGRDIGPYITFAHPKRSDEWSKLSAKFPNLVEGDLYLVEPGCSTYLPTAKLGWLVGRQYWAEVNPAGEVQRVSWNEMPRPWKEHAECVVVVYLENRIVPANVQFRSTKCPAAKTLADTFIEASSPGWAEKSPQHKETLVCAQPFMRFYGNVSIGPQRTSKSTGLPYKTVVCKIAPTSVSEWRLLKTFCESETSQKLLEQCASFYQGRLNELQTKAK